MDNGQDGLWALEIGDTLGVVPGGVIVCRQGDLAGGNDQYFYVGHYDVNGKEFEADVRVTHYNDVPGSLFGTADNIPFLIKGITADSEMDLIGWLPTLSDTKYMVRMRRLGSAQ